MAQWDQYAERAETAIDAFFGEQVRLLPYNSLGGGYVAPEPDAGRSSKDTIGYVIGRTTSMQDLTGGAGLIRMRTAADLILGIREEYLAGFDKGDRVILLERDPDQMYEISYVEPSSSGRRKLHLLKAIA